MSIIHDRGGKKATPKESAGLAAKSFNASKKKVDKPTEVAAVVEEVAQTVVLEETKEELPESKEVEKKPTTKKKTTKKVTEK